MILKLIRRLFFCSRDIHCRMKYDSGLSNDIGKAGTCLDCGYRTDGIKWPRCSEIYISDAAIKQYNEWLIGKVKND